jgi:hypothetical protein
VGRHPEQEVAHPDVQQPLGSEQAHLPGVVPGLVSEGPQGVPQVTVNVRQAKRHDVVQDEKLRAPSRPDEQKQVEYAKVYQRVGDTHKRELRVLAAPDRRTQVGNYAGCSGPRQCFSAPIL